MNKPYTYLIGWKKQNKFYYGVRYSKKCKPDDLWVTYFTSSKYVREFRNQYGEPDIIQIRRTFKDKKSAKNWEDKVLRRLNCVFDDKWLNKANLNAFKSVVMTDEIKNNISISRCKNRIKRKMINNGEINKLIPLTEEIPEGWILGKSEKLKEKLRLSYKSGFHGKTEEEIKEIGRKISNKTKGKKKPNDHGKNVSLALKGKSKPWQQGDNNVSKRPEVKEKISKAWHNRELGVWYTDEKNNFYIKSSDYVDPTWRKGRASTNKKWYNDGITSIFVTEDSVPKKFKQGRIHTNKFWWNNGVINTKSNSSPGENWVRGRILSEEAKNNIKNANSKPKSEEHRKNLSLSKRKLNGNSNT